MEQRRVKVLPEEIANKIAAGEVVQRPESVVKELLENSLDAESRSISVSVKDGGTNLVQVSDDGTGMDEADAVNAFGRHATSKIVSYEDLEAIRTFGFRGEALASIAAVARVTMKTRRRDEDEAVIVTTDGGGKISVSRGAREPGTTVTVQNLFFNVPARRKFLKSATTEFRHVYDAVHRVAISYPEIALEFVSDGDQILRLSPSALPQRLLDVLGERQLSALIPVEERSELLSVTGYISKPSFALRSRAHQYVFLNRRYIGSRTINHAVFSSYENLLEKGSFPFFLLFLDVDPHRVDVNIHPSKMEAKFEDEQGVYRAVASMVRKSLSSPEYFPSLGLTGEGGETGLRFTPAQHEWPGGRGPAGMQGGGGQQGAWTFPERTKIDPVTGEIVPLQPGSGGIIASQLLGGGEVVRGPGSEQPRPPSGAPLWQLHNKYILAAIENGVMIIDQHVAHERILYERALRRFDTESRSSQQLLFPKTVELSPADYVLVEEIKEDLGGLGFDLKLFGRNTIVVEGVPTDVRVGDEERILEEVLTLYKEYRRDAPTNVRDNLAKSYSCRSAVKAGDPLTEEEMRALITDLFATRMPYVCPHGRPIVLRISIEEMDRRFGRL
jgi:DNA mismatch repair protein MutL